jgi:hypothetical protein
MSLAKVLRKEAEKTALAELISEYLPEKIISNLGLDNPLMLHGKRVLDVGCGFNHLFVDFLRSHGVDTHGLNPRLRAPAEHLMTGYVQFIPKENNAYDLVLAHSSVLRCGTVGWYETNLRAGLSQEHLDGIIENEYLPLLLEDLNEMLRVTKPGGEIRVWPAPLIMFGPHVYRVKRSIGQMGSYRIEDVENRKHAQLVVDFGDVQLTDCPDFYKRLIITKA